MVLTKFWQMCACPLRYQSLLQFNVPEEQVSSVSAACDFISGHVDGLLVNQRQRADFARSSLGRVIGFYKRTDKRNLH